MPRGSGPTTEELEFVFDCFARGLEGTVILEEMEGTEFPRRDPRTIGRYRLSWDVAKRVLLRQESTMANPVVERAIQRHYEDLNTGLQLLKIYLESFRPSIRSGVYKLCPKRIVNGVPSDFERYLGSVEHRPWLDRFELFNRAIGIS